jgi:DNA replication and repair protein RecF
MRSLAIASVSVRGFRNLAAVDIELGTGFNVIAGDNGQGKTNLLEAMYVLATSRSFRTTRLGELMLHGGDVASVRGRIVEGDDAREQSVGVRPGMRMARVDGKRPATLAAYALRTPTVVFHPGSVALSQGGGAERRRLLDRVALYLSPASLADADAYAKALRARQRVLETRGESAVDLDGWEDLVVRHGLALSEARAAAASRLGPTAERSFVKIGPAGLTLTVRYERSCPAEAEHFRSQLAERRSRDRARGSASIGPHRDDLLLSLGARPVRGVASQGQHRAVVLALELAEIAVVADARGVRPILLLDDVSSELDRARTSALFVALRAEDSQVLLTTTRPELIETLGVETFTLGAMKSRRDFVVVEGQITPS